MLTRGVTGYLSAQLCDGLAAPAAGERRLGASFEHLRAPLLERHDVGAQGYLVGEAGERRPAPQRHRLGRASDRLRGVPTVQSDAGSDGQPLKLVAVDAVPVAFDAVPSRA